jgi:DHA1 family bicyclomycin/chloramphenicol resistance-like MFS transporter
MWLLVVILGLLTAVGPFSVDMYLPAFPDVQRELHAHASDVQLTLTACLIGLAVGQLIAGPIGDAKGRRTPVLVGLTVYVASSIGCMLAPSIGVLALLRFVQGLSGAAGIVITRAIARDLFSGTMLARFFSVMMLVSGLGPILAPVVGGQVLRLTTWRGTFGVLAALGVVLLVLTSLFLRETLPKHDRVPLHPTAVATRFGVLLRDSRFVVLALTGGCSYAVMFAYISGSSFVLQDMFGLSPQTYSLCFAINAAGIMACGQLNARAVVRLGSPKLLTAGLLVQVLGAITVLVVACRTELGVATLLVGLFLAVASVGLVGPNAAALALDRYGAMAGTASASLGLAQFAIGGVLAPLAGAGGNGTAVPMGLVMLGASATAVVAWFGFGARYAEVTPNIDG